MSCLCWTYPGKSPCQALRSHLHCTPDTGRSTAQGPVDCSFARPPKCAHHLEAPRQRGGSQALSNGSICKPREAILSELKGCGHGCRCVVQLHSPQQLHAHLCRGVHEYQYSDATALATLPCLDYRSELKYPMYHGDPSFLHLLIRFLICRLTLGTAAVSKIEYKSLLPTSFLAHHALHMRSTASIFNTSYSPTTVAGPLPVRDISTKMCVALHCVALSKKATDRAA